MARKKSAKKTLTKKSKSGGQKKASSKKKTSKATRVRAAKKQARGRSKAAATGGAMTPPATGAWVWHELMTTDAPSALSFYGTLFGWKSAQMDMGGWMYNVLSHAGKDHGGMMSMDGPQWQGVRPHWMVYVAVNDVDATAKRAQELGGRICVPPTDIPVGRFAVIDDPQGATFSIYKAKSR